MHGAVGGVVGCDRTSAGVVVYVIVVLLFDVAGLGNQRVFIVGGECVLCGFLDVAGGVCEVFKGGDGMRTEVECGVAGDGSGG